MDSQELCPGVLKCKHKIFRGPGGELYCGAEINAINAEKWSNNACRGYLRKAMERVCIKPEDIEAALSNLEYIFDEITLDEAEKYSQL